MQNLGRRIPTHTETGGEKVGINEGRKEGIIYSRCER